MKLDINEAIKDYESNPVIDAGGPLTIRRLLRMYAGSYVPEQGPDGRAQSNAAEISVIANAVAIKIHNANGELELTEEELKILKDTIATPRHAAMVYSQIHACVHKTAVLEADLLEETPGKAQDVNS
jgi:hypothetical protein